MTTSQPLAPNILATHKRRAVALVQSVFCILFAGLAISALATETLPARVEQVRTIIEAVNVSDAELYASVFAEGAVVQLYSGPVRVRGREELLRNRSMHFERFPQARSEIQYLIEVGDRVVMHDRVWLRDTQSEPAEIVEIFEFNAENQVTHVSVIQADGLLRDAE